MMTASVNLSDGPLKELSRQLDEAKGSYVKVGVLGAGARRERGQTGLRRWKGTYKRWSKEAGRFLETKPTWSPSAGKFLTNAEVGVIHEFGAPNAKIPERSFLRMPILSRLDDEIRTVPAGDWKDLLVSSGLPGVLRAIGQSAVNVIQMAFHTGGFGRWAKLKPATMRRKGSSDILVDSTQLRRSITFAVVSPTTPGRARE